jgi:hypothetical protein
MKQNPYTYFDVLELIKTENINAKEACNRLNLSYKSLYRFKKKNNIKIYKRGIDPNCRTAKRKYNLDDNYFKDFVNESCYWAGFIAADGNISKKDRKISISLQTRDRSHLETFKNNINYEGDIKDYQKIKNFNNKGDKTYYHSTLTFTSQIIIDDLENNYFIIPNKSKILQFPNFTDKNSLDSFIKGYIDGDGTIGLNEQNNECSLSLISGSLQFIEKIAERFSEILEIQKTSIYSDGANRHVIRISNKKARTVLAHLLKVETPELKRKWDKARDHIPNFNKKHRNDFKLRIILDFLKEGLTKSEIAGKMGMTYQAVHYYLTKPYYRSMVEKMA